MEEKRGRGRPKKLEGEKKTRDQYNKESYDDLRIRVRKGKKQIIEDYVKAKGDSINGFVNSAIDEKMERDG